MPEATAFFYFFVRYPGWDLPNAGGRRRHRRNVRPGADGGQYDGRRGPDGHSQVWAGRAANSVSLMACYFISVLCRKTMQTCGSKLLK